MATNPKRTLSILLGVSVTLALALFLIPVFLGFQAIAQIDYRCERHPPEEAFRRFVSPDLTEISDVRAMGQSSLGGANLFVRFQASDAALKRLLAGYVPSGPGAASQGALEQLAMDAEMWAQADAPSSGQYAVRAEEIRKVKKPVAYQKRGSINESWSMLVLDKARRRAYFYHWNQ